MSVNENGEAEEIQLGDIVRLKSGGCEMTVLALGPHGEVRCVWFDAENHLQRSNFTRSTLVYARTAPHTWPQSRPNSK
jgi:uncharacterized protein YodC (DUF2158 family)